MKRIHTILLLLGGWALLTAGCRAPRPGMATSPILGFNVKKTLVLEGSPTEVFDAFTGDVSGWWDHHFSKKPLRLFIEPKPGGRFMEVFDAAGNGAIHATVIYAERGKRLRFTGPLGFSGKAVIMVHTFDFQGLPDGRTRLRLDLRGMGVLPPAWVAAASRVWDHFLFRRFKPYFRARRRVRARAP